MANIFIEVYSFYFIIACYIAYQPLTIIVNKNYSTVEMVMTSSGKLVRRQPFISQVAEMELDAEGKFIRKRPFAGYADMELNTNSVTIKTVGSQVLELINLNLHAGDEVIIDTEKMTITVNGVNSINILSDDSVFLNLSPGANTVSVETDNIGAEADIYVLWKDRWL